MLSINPEFTRSCREASGIESLTESSATDTRNFAAACAHAADPPIRQAAKSNGKTVLESRFMANSLTVTGDEFPMNAMDAV